MMYIQLVHLSLPEHWLGHKTLQYGVRDINELAIMK